MRSTADETRALHGRGRKRRTLRITPQQWKVLQAFASGKTRKETAALLGLSVKTVQSHVAAISQALGQAPGWDRILKQSVRP